MLRYNYHVNFRERELPSSGSTQLSKILRKVIKYKHKHFKAQAQCKLNHCYSIAIQYM